MKYYLPILLMLLAVSCTVQKQVTSYEVPTQVSVQNIAQLPSPFPQLSDLERHTDWGKELTLGKRFVANGDLETSLFCFKRANLLSTSNPGRILEIEYDLFLNYYLLKRYQDAVSLFELSTLPEISSQIPIRPQLLALLIDSYTKLKKQDKVLKLLSALSFEDEKMAARLQIWHELTQSGKITTTSPLASEVTAIQKKMVHPFTAECMNTILPGAGYAYLGQYKTAFTSLSLNALFIAAGVQFISKGAVAAGIITLGFEMGWYLGGIHGGGLAAQHYNEQLWKKHIKPLCEREQLFPISQLQYGF